MPRNIVVNLSSNGRYWQASWNDSGGKRHKKSVGPKSTLSRRQAGKHCQQLANELNKRSGLADAGQSPKLGAYVEQFLNSRTDLKPATRYLFKLTGKYLRQFFGEDLPIDQITRQWARDWRTALARGDFSKGRAMEEVSVCHRTADAKAIFKRAVDDDVILFNPFDRLKVKAPKPDKGWHYVSLPELDKLLAACTTQGWKTLIALCRLAGLRRGEALALPWSGVDWQRRRLTVYAEKTGAKRILPIDPKLYKILLETFERAPEGETRVCPVNGHCLWRNFTVIRRHAGLPPWKDAFQVMRRNCETDWAQLFPQYAVSEWIGHDITVSATHYLAVTEELYQKAAGVPPKPEGSAAPTAEADGFAPKSAPKP